MADRLSQMATATKAVKLQSKIGLNVASATTQDLIVQINAGFPYSVLEQFKKATNFTTGEIAQVMRVPVRTLARRSREKRLNATESERLLRLSRLFEKAVDLFEGDREGARVWFRQPKRALGGVSPFVMAETEVGSREVENLIGRLEHGVFT